MAEAIAGLRGTGEWPANINPETLNGRLLKTRRAGIAPVFALTEMARNSSTTTTTRIDWVDQKEEAIILTVSGAHGAADNLITVTGAMPNAASYETEYGSARMLKEGDMLRVVPTAASASYTDEIVVVTQVMSDTQFTVQRGFANSTAAALADGQKMVYIGSAYAQGTGAPQARAINPDTFHNFTQIHKETVEITANEDISNSKLDVKTRAKHHADAMFKMAQGIEHALIYGKKSETVGSNGKKLTTMGGIREFIPASRTTVFSAAVTYSSFVDAVAPCFEYTGSMASDQRVLFCSNSSMLALTKAFGSSGDIQIRQDATVTSYGLKFREVVTPLGVIYMKTHPLMTKVDALVGRNTAIIVDFSALELVYMKSRNRPSKLVVKPNVQGKDEDLVRDLILTEFSLKVYHGGLTLGWLENITA